MSIERLIGHLIRIGLIAALAGGGAAVWTYIAHPDAFFGAWLAAFYFWVSMPVGALALLLIWDLTGGRWQTAGRVPLHAITATMPLFALLFLPMLAGLDTIYPWTQPERAPELHNRWYLNLGFFYARTGAYFAVWIGFAAWRLFRPATEDGAPPRGLQWVSAVGLLLMLYTVSYAGIDWIMSSEPDWFSSIYGMIVCAAQFVTALALALLLIVLLGPTDEAATPAFRNSLGSLAAILLAAVIFWAYAQFCQWLIIWEENLHSEIPWYLERWSAPWTAVIYTLVLAYFVLPFLTLVWTPTKRNPKLVGPVCVLLLAANMLHVWWLLLPGLQTTWSWVHAAVMVGMGGLWLLALAGALKLSGGRGEAPVRQEFAHG